MIKGDSIKEEVIKENIGSYILLGGHGLIDGIKYGIENYKEYAKIIKLDKNTDTDTLRMYAKKYRAHDLVYLPEYEWKQEYIIISKKEYNKLKLKSKAIKKQLY